MLGYAWYVGYVKVCFTHLTLRLAMPMKERNRTLDSASTLSLPCSVMVMVDGAIATDTNTHFSGGTRAYAFSMAPFRMSTPAGANTTKCYYGNWATSCAWQFGPVFEFAQVAFYSITKKSNVHVEYVQFNKMSKGPHRASASASMSRQLCDDASDNVLIENNGVAPVWGCSPILEWLYCFQWEHYR